MLWADGPAKIWFVYNTFFGFVRLKCKSAGSGTVRCAMVAQINLECCCLFVVCLFISDEHCSKLWPLRRFDGVHSKNIYVAAIFVKLLIPFLFLLLSNFTGRCRCAHPDIWTGWVYI